LPGAARHRTSRPGQDYRTAFAWRPAPSLYAPRCLRPKQRSRSPAGAGPMGSPLMSQDRVRSRNSPLRWQVAPPTDGLLASHKTPRDFAARMQLCSFRVFATHTPRMLRSFSFSEVSIGTVQTSLVVWILTE
jgi:hypothetical protein